MNEMALCIECGCDVTPENLGKTGNPGEVYCINCVAKAHGMSVKQFRFVRRGPNRIAGKKKRRKR